MSAPLDVTPRQREVLRVIADFLARHGYPAGFRDIAAELDIVSTNGVSDHLEALEKKGLVTRDFKVARSIRLTDAGKRVLQ